MRLYIQTLIKYNFELDVDDELDIEQLRLLISSKMAEHADRPIHPLNLVINNKRLSDYTPKIKDICQDGCKIIVSENKSVKPLEETNTNTHTNWFNSSPPGLAIPLATMPLDEFFSSNPNTSMLPLLALLGGIGTGANSIGPAVTRTTSTINLNTPPPLVNVDAADAANAADATQPSANPAINPMQQLMTILAPESARLFHELIMSYGNHTVDDVVVDDEEEEEEDDEEEDNVDGENRNDHLGVVNDDDASVEMCVCGCCNGNNNTIREEDDDDLIEDELTNNIGAGINNAEQLVGRILQMNNNMNNLTEIDIENIDDMVNTYGIERDQATQLYIAYGKVKDLAISMAFD